MQLAFQLVFTLRLALSMPHCCSGVELASLVCCQSCRNIAEKQKREEEEAALNRPTKASAGVSAAAKQPAAGEKRKNRWDQSIPDASYVPQPHPPELCTNYPQ